MTTAVDCTVPDLKTTQVHQARNYRVSRAVQPRFLLHRDRMAGERKPLQQQGLHLVGREFVGVWQCPATGRTSILGGMRCRPRICSMLYISARS